MSKFGEIFYNLVSQSLNQVRGFIVQYGPAIVFALSIVFLGWICAVVIKKIISKLLKTLGFDILAEKTGISRFLERGEIKSKPSRLVGLIFYWIIILNALIMASDAIDLKITSQFIQQAIFYVPKIIAVVIFLALAIFISNFVYNIVEKTAHAANIPLHKLLGNAARYATIGLAVMITLEYLELATSTVMQFFVVIFIIVPLGLFLAFLVGGRDIISCILARGYLIREYKKGDTITFDSTSGQIETIDLLATKLISGNEEIIIPHSELVKKIIKKSRKGD